LAPVTSALCPFNFGLAFIFNRCFLNKHPVAAWRVPSPLKYYILITKWPQIINNHPISPAFFRLITIQPGSKTIIIYKKTISL
jgi:hypothetical protein